ncbi:protein resistance to phytophthora 1 [Citrus sinensis]|uniref:Protein resistance to phytophthora 1 n=3 Tax=Citrus sinensis TaxID=2711 RepID=A0ACB8MJG2_CITSI|nr:uncharacterized protein LOC18046999 isoform X1 [Citrus x clementina]KAH9730044.1 protein resistance to phytophthora 1 [Citrus sinensis]KAH9786027.1 protein resistance to phytophthora 1 [Citrus sinensis]KAH9786032.1 protein resistance to phytophthora 1 [Citrus sinensis]KDO87499.1 hypothetical protein CISIN_1g027319mg [Citrus sinensis]
MNTLIISTSPYSCHVSKFPLLRNRLCWPKFRGTSLKIQASANEVDAQATVEESSQNEEPLPEPKETNKLSSTAPPALDKDLKKVVQKTAATFAPRASTATKNPAVPGTILYTVFEVQGYASMLLGGALSFNLIFPSNEPDIWRLMGMWSIWMFAIPSLRARDCSKNEKEALNYLFLLIPLLNVIIPFFWKSFSVVWSADTVAFFAMYAWKVWFVDAENVNLTPCL